MERVRIDSLEVNLKSAFRNPESAILFGALLFALCFSVEAQEPPKVRLWRARRRSASASNCSNAR